MGQNSIRFIVLIVCMSLLTLPAFAKTTSAASTGTTSVVTGKSSSVKKSGKKSSRGKVRRAKSKRNWKRRGQQAIEADRTREIQEALIRAEYLEGDTTGKWDQRTKEAMKRFQADNGWQTVRTPDSRALIKLGLGPSGSSTDLLNETDDSEIETSAISIQGSPQK